MKWRDYEPLDLDLDLPLWEREFEAFEGELGYSQRHYVGRLIATLKQRERETCSNCGAWRECQVLWRYFPPFFGCVFFRERDEDGKNLDSCGRSRKIG